MNDTRVRADFQKEMSIVTEEAEELLVSMVQERPALYDIREKHYANRAKKTELWGEIQNKLGIPGEISYSTTDPLCGCRAAFHASEGKLLPVPVQS